MMGLWLMPMLEMQLPIKESDDALIWSFSALLTS
jgi:hypothetical protein